MLTLLYIGRRSHDATDDDVEKAHKLFNTSTMDAAKSGINQQINMTSEMANEIKVSGKKYSYIAFIYC